MAKRQGRNTRAEDYDYDYEEIFEPTLQKVLGKRFRLKCKNEAQKEFSNLITEKQIVIAAGPAGTGKSYVMIARAIELLQNVSNPYKKVIISKPAVESEEKIGFIPGTVREKMEPHLASSLDIVDKIVGKVNRLKLESQDMVMIQPLGFIRGKTFDNAIIIIEEAQNLSKDQCKAILTRIGYGSKLIISGDLDQSDRYKDVKQSGLYDLFAKHHNVADVGFYEFGLGDIVRNPIITKLLANYPKQELPDLSNIKEDETPSTPVRPQTRVIPEGSSKTKITPAKVKLPLLERVNNFFSEKFTW